VVIDDDEVIRLSCQQILDKAGYRVETFGNGHAGIRRIQEIKPPLLIVDIKMPELDGFEVIHLVREVDPDLVIVVITGYATIETAVDAMKAGAYDFLPKPFTPNELRMIIERGFERWRLTKEAQRLRQEKEEVERKFVTLVSHQLKSPLVAVKQYLDVLQLTSQNQLSEKGQEWVRRSQVRLAEMLAIIQDWLAVSRIDSGSLCERGSAADLEKVVAEVIAECRPIPDAPEVQIQISTSIPADFPKVCGDPMSLTMLMENLISNAVKYNRAGGSVTVAASEAGEFARVEVRDTGIGIPDSALLHIFEEFYRVKSEATAKIPGTGLGLVICRKIVQELGGRIDIQSRPGEGTTVILHLPIALKKVSQPGELP
jgi:two-component system, sensor histidine kinase and response regulator